MFLLLFRRYSTHYTGKWDAGWATNWHLPINRGFDTAFGYLKHANDYWQYILLLPSFLFVCFWFLVFKRYWQSVSSLLLLYSFSSSSLPPFPKIAHFCSILSLHKPHRKGKREKEKMIPLSPNYHTDSQRVALTTFGTTVPLPMGTQIQNIATNITRFPFLPFFILSPSPALPHSPHFFLISCPPQHPFTFPYTLFLSHIMSYPRS